MKKFEKYNIFWQKGVVDVLTLVGLAIMLLTLPAASKLVSERQEIRQFAQESVCPIGCCGGECGTCPSGQACDIPNGACSSGLSCNPQGYGYHKACQDNLCVEVPGEGTDACNSNDVCKQNQPIVCTANQCCGTGVKCNAAGTACNVTDSSCGKQQVCWPENCCKEGFKCRTDGSACDVPDTKCTSTPPTPTATTPSCTQKSCKSLGYDSSIVFFESCQSDGTNCKRYKSQDCTTDEITSITDSYCKGTLSLTVSGNVKIDNTSGTALKDSVFINIIWKNRSGGTSKGFRVTNTNGDNKFSFINDFLVGDKVEFQAVIDNQNGIDWYWSKPLNTTITDQSSINLNFTINITPSTSALIPTPTLSPSLNCSGPCENEGALGCPLLSMIKIGQYSCYMGGSKDACFYDIKKYDDRTTCDAGRSCVCTKAWYCDDPKKPTGCDSCCATLAPTPTSTPPPAQTSITFSIPVSGGVTIKSNPDNVAVKQITITASYAKQSGESGTFSHNIPTNNVSLGSFPFSFTLTGNNIVLGTSIKFQAQAVSNASSDPSSTSIPFIGQSSMNLNFDINIKALTPPSTKVSLGGTCENNEQCEGYTPSSFLCLSKVLCWEKKCKNYNCNVGVCNKISVSGNNVNACTLSTQLNASTGACCPTDSSDPCPKLCPKAAIGAQPPPIITTPATSTLIGHVGNSTISNGTITLVDPNGKKYTTKTDKNGDFTIDAPSNQTYMVTVSAPGYKPFTFTWDPSDGKDYFSDIKLEKLTSAYNGFFKIEEKIDKQHLINGWNLISLSVKPKEILTASGLTKQINNQGGNVTSVSRWKDGAWESYITGVDKNDFPIETGVAYFVENGNEAFYNLDGEQITQPQPLELVPGWNPVGLPKTINCGTGSDCYSRVLLNLIDVTKTNTAKSIAQFNSSLWETTAKENQNFFGHNFKILPGIGYFLKVTRPIRLLP